MKKSKVVLDFIKFSIPEKIMFFRNVITQMTGKASFPTPDVALAVAKTAVDTLEADHTAAKSGAHVLVSKMRQSAEAADNLFRKLALYVDRIADGNETIILSSGFHVSKQPEASVREAFVVDASENPSEIILIRKAQPGARSYIWQYCVGALPTNGQPWIFAGASTQTRYVIKDLESGSKCWFRVAAITSSGQEPWSDPVMKVVP